MKKVRKIRKNYRTFFLLLPSLMGFTIFYVIPFFRSIYYAFVDNAFHLEFAGIQNFREIFGSEYFRLALKNTLLFTAIVVPVSLLSAILIASVLMQIHPIIAGGVQSALFLPVLLPSAAVTLFWKTYLFFLPPFISLLIFYMWKYIGLYVMLILCGMVSVEREILEAASIDGADGWRRLWQIEVPCIRSAVFFVGVLCVVNAFKIYRESFLLYGTYPDESVYMLQNYLNNHFDKLNYQYISAASVCFTGILAGLTIYAFTRERQADGR